MARIIAQLNNVCKRYGPETVLGPFSLTLTEGERVGLAGPNGAGKSTMLKILAGVLRASAGERLIADGITLGYVPQDVSLYPQLSGRDNLSFFAEAAGVCARERQRRTEALLERLALTQCAKARVETYSGGMKRRLNLAAALVAEPKLLLLDEPTVGADEYSAERIEAELCALRARGGTILLISHEREALRLCGRVITLTGGRAASADVREGAGACAL